MSLHDHAPSHALEEGHGDGHATHHPNYVKIYLILLVLLVISILGPELEIRVVTLITAFGVACVKAWMVAKNFMHITFTQRFVPYLIVTMLVFMLLFFAGASPDVMKAQGRNWVKPSWIADNVEYQKHHPGGAPGGEHH